MNSLDADDRNIQMLLIEQQALIQELCTRQSVLAQKCLASNQAIIRCLSVTGQLGNLANAPASDKQIPLSEESVGVQSHEAVMPSAFKQPPTSIDFFRRAYSDPSPAIEEMGTKSLSDGNAKPLTEPLLKPEAEEVPKKRKAKGVPKSMFGPSAADVKGQVLQALRKPSYNVEDYYKHDGFCQWLATDSTFNNMTLFVILLNTIWIAIETDYNKATVLSEAPWPFQIVDNLFTVFFSFEIVLRFGAFEHKRDAFKDTWFCFDSLLVGLMVWETWVVVLIVSFMSNGMSGGGFKKMAIFRLFRLLRLTRVARLARLLRAFPELLVLTKGALMGLRSVGATLILLAGTIYVYSIMFTQCLSETEMADEGFGTVPETMHVLLLRFCLNVDADLLDKLLQAGLIYYVIMLSYIVVGTFTVMNMLIGVICEVVSNTASAEREDILVQDLKYKISKMLPETPLDDSYCPITKEDFQNLLNKDEALQSLDEVDVDVVALIQLGDFIFRESDELDMVEVMQMVLQFRGSNSATVKDVVDMRMFVSKELVAMENRFLKAVGMN